MSALLRPIVQLTHTLTEARVLLSIATVLAAGLFAAGTIWLSHARLAVGTSVFAAAALIGLTVATFTHFFDTNGWSGRPVTASQAGVYDWLDEKAGTNASVTEVPYLVSTDYFVSEQRWRDVEFWNKSITRDALDPGGDVFAYTGIWFPKLTLAFDPATGLADVSPSPWAAVSDKDTRFGLAGSSAGTFEDVELMNVDQPWRAQWLSFGLYDDGWTKPGTTARIRVYPNPGQHGAHTHFFVFAVRPPDDVASRPVQVVSNIGRWAGNVSNAATTSASVNVCVPAHGYAEIRISTPDASAIPGDAATLAQTLGQRRGGVFFGFMAVSSSNGAACTP